jgi:DNA-binding transcriptional MerR regulator
VRSAAADPRVAPTRSIGEVLAELQPDFPEITISKIRFLESAGLLEPQRTPSGYRRFGPGDVARLRYVLAAQRDHYLPLRVIRDHLDAIDRGLEPPALGLPVPRVPAALAAAANGDGRGLGDGSGDGAARVRLSRAELADAAGLTSDGLAELEQFGLVAPVDGYFDGDALTVARTVAALGEYGLHPRHLRPVKAAADREVDLIEQVVSPLRAHRSPKSRSRAEEVAEELAGLSVRLHAALVKSGLTTTAVPSIPAEPIGGSPR